MQVPVDVDATRRNPPKRDVCQQQCRGAGNEQRAVGLVKALDADIDPVDELVIPENQDFPPRRRAQPFDPTSREAARRQIAEIHDRVCRIHDPPPRVEQLVVHLLRRPVRPPERADALRMTQVKVRPHPDVPVVLLTQLSRLHPARGTPKTVQPPACIGRQPQVVELLPTEFSLVTSASDQWPSQPLQPVPPNQRDLTPAPRTAPATGPSCGPATTAPGRERPPSVGGPSTAWAGSRAPRPTR